MNCPTAHGPCRTQSLLACCMATIALTTVIQEPLGVPKINPDESSSSSEEEPEPPVQLPKRGRRASSLARAGNAALSLSNKPDVAAIATIPSLAADSAVSNPARTTTDGGQVRLVAVEDTFRRLLVAAPTYPSGVGGRLIAAVSSSSAAGLSGSGDASKNNNRKRYRMVFDGKEEARHPLAGGPGEGGTVGEDLVLGLEAIPDENDPTLLCVRGLEPGETNAAGGAGKGRIIARIKATPTVPGGRESIHRVLLEGGKGRQETVGELMAVRITTHPTRLAAPREVRAVLLCSPQGEGAGGKYQHQQNGGWVCFAYVRLCWQPVHLF